MSTWWDQLTLYTEQLILFRCLRQRSIQFLLMCGHFYPPVWYRLYPHISFFLNTVNVFWTKILSDKHCTRCMMMKYKLACKRTCSSKSTPITFLCRKLLKIWYRLTLYDEVGPKNLSMSASDTNIIYNYYAVMNNLWSTIGSRRFIYLVRVHEQIWYHSICCEEATRQVIGETKVSSRRFEWYHTRPSRWWFSTYEKQFNFSSNAMLENKPGWPYRMILMKLPIDLAIVMLFISPSMFNQISSEW